MPHFKKKIVGYSLVVSLVTQILNITVWGVWFGFFAPTPFQVAVAADSKFQEIKNKYQTDDPTNNRGTDSRLNSTLQKYSNQQSSNRNVEQEVISKYYLSPQNSGTVDLSRYGNYSSDFTSRLSDSISVARGIGSNVSTSSIDNSGNIKSSYNEQGVELTKSDTGDFSATLDQSGVAVHSMADNEFTSSEINHSQTIFEADNHYGDESSFYNSGKTRINTLKTGTSSDATAYQTIQEIQRTNRPPEINPRDSMFNYGFNEVNDAISGTGNWLSSCTTNSYNIDREFTSSTSINHLCMEPATDNQFYCEVERTYTVSHIVESVSGDASVSACGDGCVEISFHAEKQKKEDQCWDESQSATIALNPHLNLASVGVSYSIEDHSIMSINGQEVWSVIKGVEGTGGALPSKGNGCIDSPTWSGSHSGNVDGAVSSALNSNSGMVNFDWTLRYGHEGEGDITIRLQLENPDGTGFGIHYIQTPEGCYDAVAPELKAVNGLTGLENGNTGGGTSSNPYTCLWEQEQSEHICYGENSDWGYSEERCSPSGYLQFQCYPPNSDGENNSEYPYSFCRFDSYTNLEVGSNLLPPSLLDSVPPWYEGDTGNKTWKVNLDGFRCDPTGGVPYCVITKRATDEEKQQGIEDEKECYDWDDIKSQPDQCQIYKDDSDCVEVSRTCAEGWLWQRPDNEEYQEDICFAYTVEYQCSVTQTHTTTSTVTENTCAATLPCVGGNCDTTNNELNDQFADAVAMASVIQHMEDGMNCDDPSDPTTCRIFEGEGKFCSWEPSGLGNDCCEAPDGINIYDYAKAAYGMLQADAYIAGLEASTNTAVGTYQALRQPIADGVSNAGQAMSDAWGAVSSAFTDTATTAAGTASGTVTDAAGGLTDIFSDQAIEELTQSVMRYAYDNLPAELAQALLQETATDTGTQVILSEGAGQVVAIIGYVYTAYMVYQYVKLALQLLTACHEYEQDMGVRLATKQCIAVGSKYCAEDFLGVCYLRRKDYCCYDSILARIIMEQASPMIGHDLTQASGTVIDGTDIKSCPGLTPEQLANINWNNIDLSEWIGIMIESGITDFNPDIDSLTGNGRMLNNEGRENAAVRTQQRVNSSSLADRAVEAKRKIKVENVDCSLVPRPLSCYFNN
ncbi:conjugal transfer protein TraN [Pseudoalteromonas spongiae]|uniref:conjugal transfer protein TraN n=1 Tax=Pseudoalteromonas spongiae TaxID=298657 RepID=UPI000C2D6140|nr:conjugal transfer protein TraN [Pseudoalteromonas spongiae]